MKKNNKLKKILIEDYILGNAINFLDNLELEIIDGKHSMMGDPKDGMIIFSITEVEDLLTNETRLGALTPRLRSLLEEGNWRPYATMNEQRMSDLEELRIKFPNFNIVIDQYIKTLRLSMLIQPAIMYVPPILLVGEPGVGKTRFLRELAKVLKVDFFQADLATTSAGFVLAGSSTTWAEGKPGMVSNSLRKSNVANPILLIDEIDKVGGDKRYDPLGCLYTLLERETAKSFVDESLQIPMNCSAINWFASANCIETIPMPIKSRFSIYIIEPPTLEQMNAIAQSVYKDLLSENLWGTFFNATLSTDVIEQLITLTPRDQKQALYNACSEAACRHKSEGEQKLTLMASDIVLLDVEPKKKTIGFY